MRATKAYIAGLGTTGILITCFLLLLTVGSAMIAFEGWPGEASGDDLERVVVKNQAERAPARSRAEATVKRGDQAPDPRAARRAKRSGRSERKGSIRRAQQSSTNEPGSVTAGGSSSGPAPARPASGAGDTARQSGGGGTRKQAPSAPDLGNTVEQATGGLGDTVESTTGGLGDTVQGATDGLGSAVGGVSPGLGETVSGTGDAAGQVLDDAGQGVDKVVEDTGRTVNGLLP